MFLHSGCSTGSDEKLKKCIELGADVGINYKTEDFVERAKAETGGKGVLLDITVHVLSSRT